MDAIRRFVLVAATVLAAQAWAAPPQVRLGESAPDFALQAIDGKTVSLHDGPAGLTVVHFAATWCPFCAAEAPHLERLHQDYRDKGVKVRIVDVGEPIGLVSRSARKAGLTFPVLLDKDGQVARRFAPPPSVLPDLRRDEVMIAANLIIDREGKIRFFSLLDSASFDAKLVGLRARLDQLLAER